MRLLLLALSIGLTSYAQTDASKDFSKTKGTWEAPLDRIVAIDTPTTSCENCATYLFLNLKTTSDSLPRFIQGGKVFLITKIQDYLILMVENGDYVLSYSGLKSTPFEMGDKVKKGQTIGIINRFNKKDFEFVISLTYKSKIQTDIMDWFTEDFRRLARAKSSKAKS